jgi:cation transporter-like permease
MGSKRGPQARDNLVSYAVVILMTLLTSVGYLVVRNAGLDPGNATAVMLPISLVAALVVAVLVTWLLQRRNPL